MVGAAARLIVALAARGIRRGGDRRDRSRPRKLPRRRSPRRLRAARRRRPPARAGRLQPRRAHVVVPRTGRATGIRVAHIPYDDGGISGTVALWYRADAPGRKPRQKLEAAYAKGVPHGPTRSWYPDGRPRGEYAYERGTLVAAKAWNALGTPLARERSVRAGHARRGRETKTLLRLARRDRRREPAGVRARGDQRHEVVARRRPAIRRGRRSPGASSSGRYAGEPAPFGAASRAADPCAPSQSAHCCHHEPG